MRRLLLLAALAFAPLGFAGNPPPTVTSVSPNTGSPSGGTTVTVTGTNFTGTTAVKFGANNATAFTVNSSTQITATAPAGSGTVDVIVTNIGGPSTAGQADLFTYLTTSVKLQDFNVK